LVHSIAVRRLPATRRTYDYLRIGRHDFERLKGVCWCGIRVGKNGIHFRLKIYLLHNRCPVHCAVQIISARFIAFTVRFDSASYPVTMNLEQNEKLTELLTKMKMLDDIDAKNKLNDESGDTEALPIMEIREELDDNDGVLRSTVKQAELNNDELETLVEKIVELEDKNNASSQIEEIKEQAKDTDAEEETETRVVQDRTVLIKNTEKKDESLPSDNPDDVELVDDLLEEMYVSKSGNQPSTNGNEHAAVGLKPILKQASQSSRFKRKKKGKQTKESKTVAFTHSEVREFDTTESVVNASSKVNTAPAIDPEELLSLEVIAGEMEHEGLDVDEDSSLPIEGEFDYDFEDEDDDSEDDISWIPDSDSANGMLWSQVQKLRQEKERPKESAVVADIVETIPIPDDSNPIPDQPVSEVVLERSITEAPLPMEIVDEVNLGFNKNNSNDQEHLKTNPKTAKVSRFKRSLSNKSANVIENHTVQPKIIPPSIEKSDKIEEIIDPKPETEPTEVEPSNDISIVQPTLDYPSLNDDIDSMAKAYVLGLYDDDIQTEGEVVNELKDFEKINAIVEARERKENSKQKQEGEEELPEDKSILTDVMEHETDDDDEEEFELDEHAPIMSVEDTDLDIQLSTDQLDQQINLDYHTLRQKMVHLYNGGFKKSEKEQEIEPIDENGNPIKISRFRAARLNLNV